MIIQNKMIKTIAVVTLAMMPHIAVAYLVPLDELSPGQHCNTQCYHSACPVAYITNVESSPDSITEDYDICNDDNTHDPYTCWYNKEPGNYVLCSTPDESACSKLAFIFIGDTGGWVGSWQTPYETLNSTKHSVISQEYFFQEADYYECTADYKPTYGCEENYYAISNIATSSINCTRCPSITTASGTTFYGLSTEGNVDITGCYIPINTTFRDDTGSGKYTQNCKYTN